MQDTSGVHLWLVLGKAFQALAAHARESLKRQARWPRGNSLRDHYGSETTSKARIV
jgi:hypothetical protein